MTKATPALLYALNKMAQQPRRGAQASRDQLPQLNPIREHVGTGVLGNDISGHYILSVMLLLFLFIYLFIYTK